MCKRSKSIARFRARWLSWNPGWLVATIVISVSGAIGWNSIVPAAVPRVGARALKLSDAARVRPSSFEVTVVADRSQGLFESTALRYSHGKIDDVTAVAMEEMARRRVICTPASVSEANAGSAEQLSIDMTDASDAQLDRLQAFARSGSTQALQAFLPLAVHRTDYVSVSQDLLYDGAARGDTFSLITVTIPRQSRGLSIL